MPGLVRENSVRADAADFNLQFLEFFVVPGEIFQFGRAHEGEVGWIEEKNQPLSFEFRQVRLLEPVFMEHFEVKVGNFLTDEREFVFVVSPAATHIILHKT